MESENLSTREDVDRELLQRLTVQLRERGFAPYRTLGLCVENGVVELQGRLPTYHLRQVAVECIKRVAGVRRVVDRIAVDPTSYPPPCERPYSRRTRWAFEPWLLSAAGRSESYLTKAYDL